MSSGPSGGWRQGARSPLGRSHLPATVYLTQSAYSTELHLAISLTRPHVPMTDVRVERRRCLGTAPANKETENRVIADHVPSKSTGRTATPPSSSERRHDFDPSLHAGYQLLQF